MTYTFKQMNINSEADFTDAIRSHRAVLFYFSTISCQVGEALEPKVRKMIQEYFPNIVFAFVDMNAQPELLGKHQVFVEPTILLFIDEKEYLRSSRNIHVQDLQARIGRIYDLAFDD